MKDKLNVIESIDLQYIFDVINIDLMNITSYFLIKNPS
jgi:hypothetical protein